MKLRTTSILAFALLFASVSKAKVRELDNRLSLRPVAVRNVEYGPDGSLFAIPNFVSAGSVALFWVNEQGGIAPVPARLSEKHFTRSSGLFYLRKKSDSDPQMAFIPLPELLSGYSVDFSEDGRFCAIAGGTNVVVLSPHDKWEKVKTLTIGSSVTRAVFSPDGTRMAVLSEGRLFLFSAERYDLLSTVEPADESRFSDITFSNDNSRCAVFENRSVAFDYSSRIRIYDAETGSPDRDLPYLPVRPSEEPGERFPLVSFGPGDTILAVTIPTFAGRIYLIRSNDGTVLREFKGFCHAFSSDGSLFVARNSVISTKDWSILGKISQSTMACAFSPTERVLIAVTRDAVRRYRVEE